jgi:N6-L-threonylcarbamoyladenine synthase
MKILAIETSCDETGIAVVDGRKTNDGFVFTVLGNALLSQASLHAEYGGVYPTLAKREHQKNLPLMLEQALAQANLSIGDADALAVTEGPGLEPALWTGITFAQKLAAEWSKPLFGVNHMEGHLLSSLAGRENIKNKISNIEYRLESVQFPILALLVSGGHTQFIVSGDWFQYTIIGETLDDAVGECFDKVARMLGLPYPGGPEISRLAKNARGDNQSALVRLPRPMIKSDSCDVSFSGLKTAALYALRDLGGSESLTKEQKALFAREFEDSVAEVFITKTHRALKESSARTFVIGGGVAANTHLRNSLVKMIEEKFPEIEIRLPELSITGDNAIMIAEAALAHLLVDDWKLEQRLREIHANGNLALAS